MLPRIPHCALVPLGVGGQGVCVVMMEVEVTDAVTPSLAFSFLALAHASYFAFAIEFTDSSVWGY